MQKKEQDRGMRRSPAFQEKIYIGYWVYRFLYRTISGSDPPQP